MRYNLYAEKTRVSRWKTVEVESEAEALEILNNLKREVALEESEVVGKLTRHASECTYQVGAIYWLKHYSSLIPVKCIHSSYNRRRKYTHGFKRLDIGEEKWFYKPRPLPRITDKELCSDGKIKEVKCNSCPAKFVCFTNAKRS